MKHLLEVRNLSVQFTRKQGVLPAVRDINFHIDPGEIVGLVGESGCGKSVTAQTVMRLLDKYTQTQGQIFFENDDLLKLDEQQMQKLRGNRIGMVFQDPAAALDPTMRIGSQITEGLRIHERISKEAINQKSLALLHQVGIGEPHERLRQYPHELSGGMKQRILIAMALACGPQLLIADEPTTALDVTIQLQILNLLKKMQKQNGFSMLFITHDLGVVANICQRVLVMHEGKIVEEGPVKEIFANPKHPYTKTLLNARPSFEKSGKLS